METSSFGYLREAGLIMMMAPRRCEHAPLLAFHAFSTALPLPVGPPFSILRFLVSLVGLPVGEATCSRVNLKFVLRTTTVPRTCYQLAS